jgi:protein-tyrosine phosphatase
MIFGMKIPNIELCDIHTHILPGLDDGARDMETALKMADIAYADGIRVIAATPHYHPGKCMSGHEKTKAVFDELASGIAVLHPDMRLYLGRELYYTSDVAEELEGGARLRYGDTMYCLVEFSTNEAFFNIKAAMNRIMQCGYIPVLAHVERYSELVEKPGRVEELGRMGVVVTVNAASVLGELGNGIKKFTLGLLKDELVDVVASDAHGTHRRTPRLHECYEYVCRKTSPEYAVRIFHENPLGILNNLEL